MEANGRGQLSGNPGQIFCGLTRTASVEGCHAYGAAPVANALTARTGNEAGGAIVPSGRGFTYTGPTAYNDPCENYVRYPDNSVATYHTHPATCEGGAPDELSELDKELVNRDKAHRPLYYITPGGRIYKYTHGGPAKPLDRGGLQ